MPNIKTLCKLTINCKKVERKETDGPENCKTNMSQEIDVTEEYYKNTENVSKFENGNKPMVTDKDKNNIKYFLSGPNSDNDKRVSIEVMQWLLREFKYIFNGIGHFNGTFSL